MVLQRTCAAEFIRISGILGCSVIMQTGNVDAIAVTGNTYLNLFGRVSAQ